MSEMVSQKDRELESLRKELEVKSTDGLNLAAKHHQELELLKQDLARSNKDLLARRNELDSLRSAMAEKERALTSASNNLDRLTSDLAASKASTREAEGERDSQRAKASQLQVSMHHF